jgi:dTDP-4-amino-4,6-dideoxygalactose transaminase
VIRLAIPSIEEDDLQAVREALASGFLVQGPRVAAFEQTGGRLCRHQARRGSEQLHRQALLLALMAIEVGPGDSVAVTTYSWPATANVIALCGAEPVFVEIEPGTFNMDPHGLGRDHAAHDSQRQSFPVHTFGGMADMSKITKVAEQYGVPVIEDAACALGAEIEGRRAGTWGLMGCFSFHPRKAITTGEGGIVTTDDASLVLRLRMLRNHGLDPEAPTPDFVLPGHNMRMTEFQAALGSTQMQKVERIIASRRSQAARYDKLFEPTEIVPPDALPGSRHVYQSYVALLPQKVSPRRPEIIAALKAQGIETTIGTYHLPLTTYFRNRGGYSTGDFPVTDDVAARAISLPLFEALTSEQQEQVATELLQLVKAQEVFA